MESIPNKKFHAVSFHQHKQVIDSLIQSLKYKRTKKSFDNWVKQIYMLVYKVNPYVN